MGSVDKASFEAWGGMDDGSGFDAWGGVDDGSGRDACGGYWGACGVGASLHSAAEKLDQLEVEGGDEHVDGRTGSHVVLVANGAIVR